MATYSGVRIISAERLSNSVNGNPRWHIVFDGEPFAAETQSDASDNYVVSNYLAQAYRERTFTITTTRAGRVATITLED